VSYSYESDDKGGVATSDVSRKGFRKKKITQAKPYLF
jgi:hypothetical protein